MLEAKEFLSSSFTDFKFEASDLLRDTKTLTSHTQSTDYIYVGYYKPINQIFFSLDTVNSLTGGMIAEYYNGSTWTSLTIFDDTKGLQRDGFVQWSKPTDWTANTIDSVEKYWIRFSVTTAADCVLTGISSLFSDDNDLIKVYPDIGDTEFKLGQPKLLNAHVEARDWIIQKLRNSGILKENASTLYLDDLQVFDVLNKEQLRSAAKYYALYTIFFNVSDNPDDIYMVKANKYLQFAQNAYKLAKFDVDSDDDGEEDAAEVDKPFFYRLER